MGFYRTSYIPDNLLYRYLIFKLIQRTFLFFIVFLYKIIMSFFFQIIKSHNCAKRYRKRTPVAVFYTF